MKKIIGVFITICIFVLNFLNMAFANTEKLSKPPRFVKNKATNRVNLQAGKPIPATQPCKVFPKVEMDLQDEVFPKVEMNDKHEDIKWEMDLKFD